MRQAENIPEESNDADRVPPVEQLRQKLLANRIGGSHADKT